MILYLTFGTSDLARAGRFYDPVLAALGYVQLRAGKEDFGYGMPGDTEPRFWIVTPYDGQPASRGNGTMLALTAPTRAAVDAFHAAALANGGSDEGKPGLRPWSANFYACYVRDPDGNKLSAVCDKPV